MATKNCKIARKHNIDENFKNTTIVYLFMCVGGEHYVGILQKWNHSKGKRVLRDFSPFKGVISTYEVAQGAQ